MNVTAKLAAALGCALDHVTPYDHPDAVSAREALAAYDAHRLETGRWVVEYAAQMRRARSIEEAELWSVRDSRGLATTITVGYGPACEGYARAIAEKLNESEPEGLLIVGNIVDGFQFVGPFACESDAAAYAQANGLPDWTTVTMRKRA